MSLIPDNVRQEIIKLVPAFVVNDISCFDFYDNHPREQNTIEIIVCTNSGEVKEFFQRDLVLCLRLDIPKPKEIRIIRNDNLDLFYLVFGANELLVLSRREDLKIHKRFKNVAKFELEDTLCSGRANLKVFLEDDAVPLVLDDNFDVVDELCNVDHCDDSMPILTQLMRKLTEARYSVQCNKMMYEKLIKLRQLALFSKYQKINLNAKEAVCKTSLKELAASVLKIDTLNPWVKLCNKKVVIVFDVTNQDDTPLDNVQVLLHGTTRPSITYVTKLFEKVNDSPFWREKKTHCIKLNKKTAIVVVIDLKEIICDISSKVVFDAVIIFNKLEKEFLLPLERVTMSSLDSMKEDFDVLNNSAIDDANTILAILATSEKTDLHIRHLRRDDEEAMVYLDAFCFHLQMELVPKASNIIIHRKGPYHALHGVMILFHNEEILRSDFTISVFTRSPSQVIALIRYIQDAVPAKMLITSLNHKIKAKTEEFSHCNEDIISTDSRMNYTDYGASILKRTTTVLEYLDNCMIKMNENKNSAIQSKIGKEIHLFADGVARYMEFRNKMLKEADQGVKQCLKIDTFSEENCEPMLID